eukprot:CAMPEP_0118928740 /NCGR_PEP_ID=MMETSP1169-20130426/5922_1 /TAXON_ID=36882 /ORGANISM="Pyramimonas obovata, Strain CCMP722" /LENGTH=507 /DNA_ID=CAMNT_0006870785 /DNA_START=316 /DNA_END=1836 /DNA_ORIENTATION=-
MSVRSAVRVVARRVLPGALPSTSGAIQDVRVGGDHGSVFVRELYAQWLQQRVLLRTIDEGAWRTQRSFELAYLPGGKYLSVIGKPRGGEIHHRAFSCARALQLSSVPAPAPATKDDESSDQHKGANSELDGKGGNSDESLEEYLAEMERLKRERRERFEKKAPGFVAEIKNKVDKGYLASREFVLSIGPLLASIMRGLMNPLEWKGNLKILWGKIKHEADHYWVGTKLLVADIKIASRLLLQTLTGEPLSRRERRQLVRTTNDIFRLVPFSLFVLIPFMEVLLPVALKLFPNMLPSTFEDKLKVEEELRKRVQAKLEIAMFLQDCVEEKAKKMKKNSECAEKQLQSRELYGLINKVRAGQEIENEQFIQFATLFSDQFTLDNLGRVQLVAMCKFLGLNAFGTDNYLRFTLRKRLSEIKKDDRLIKREGLKTLTYDELQSACRSRGMRWAGETAFGMRRQLDSWLDLSLEHKMPSSLLILSRALAYTSTARFEERAVMEDMKSALSEL